MYLVKILLISLLFGLLSACGESVSEIAKKQVHSDLDAKQETFLAWYNGWGMLTVWGVGQVSGSCYTCGSVYCGSKEVRFTVTYDTHTQSADSNYPESKKYAQAYNNELNKYFIENNNECKFKIIKDAEKTTSNNTFNNRQQAGWTDAAQPPVN